jgi:dienelactone hydrolase
VCGQAAAKSTPKHLWLALAASAAEPQEVVFPSGSIQLHGFVFTPQGDGPFPAVLYNHGSEKRPGPKPEIGEFFAANGYVLFIPHRRGHGRSPGSYIMDALNNASRASRWQLLVSLHDQQQDEVVAALAFLKTLSYVDTQNVAVAGRSFGGIQTILSAERDLGLRAAIAFAPAAMMWNAAPEMQSRLIAAVRRATIPLFLIQAANDYDLSPTRRLSQEMERAGKTHVATIFPTYGTTQSDGHGGFCFRGTHVWGSEVVAFLASNRHR